MDKIIPLKFLINQLTNCPIAGKNKVVLATGCFDLLHKAHKDFLKAAKSKGHLLLVGLEPDARVKQLKGKNRPILNWKKRAVSLAKLAWVDFVFPLPEKFSDIKHHLKLLKQIKPKVLAVSENTPFLENKKNLITKIGGILFIYPYNTKYSTSKILKNS